jgi:hypothetical protein
MHPTIDAGGALPGPRLVHRFGRRTSAPGEIGCMRAGRKTQTPHAAMPAHHSNDDFITERSCGCHSTSTRSADMVGYPLAALAPAAAPNWTICAAEHG